MAPVPARAVVRRTGRRICAVLTLLALAACAPQPVVTKPDRAATWVAHRAQLSGLRDWELRGRIAVKLEQDAFSATLHWRQAADAYNLRVIAPLGRGTFELSGDADGVELRTADNRVFRADNPEALLQENLGWQLPVSGLRWWVRGLPRPGVATTRLDVSEAGWLTALTQDGWAVQYEEQRAEGEVMLPGKLSLENGPVRVRLAVTVWQTGAP